jgi:26S proteasome regulatory subunit N6
MSSTTDLLAKAEALQTDNLKGREVIYKQILEASKSTVDPDGLRDQETALVKLGELYRDQK